MNRVEAIVGRVRDFALTLEQARALVTVSFAQSIDGSIAFKPGAPTRFSNEMSLTMTHRLRAEHDAVVVGVGTILCDDPQLNVRLGSGSVQPRRVVLDRQLRTPASSRLLTSEGGEVFIAASLDACQSRAQALEQAGATILRWPNVDFEPPRVRLRLRKEGLSRVMVEGGARLISSFFETDCVDYTVITISPQLSAHRDSVRYSYSMAQRVYDMSACHHSLLGGDIVLDGAPR
ncbi:MAG: RibD family protein [Myxococcota bacterium]